MKEKDKFDIELGSILRDLRKAKKLSMREAGERVGCTSQMVSLYELGNSALTVSMLKKFCDVYGVKYYDIIRQAGENEQV